MMKSNGSTWSDRHAGSSRASPTVGARQNHELIQLLAIPSVIKISPFSMAALEGALKSTVSRGNKLTKQAQPGAGSHPHQSPRLMEDLSPFRVASVGSIGADEYLMKRTPSSTKGKLLPAAVPAQWTV
jgi:hypothetical protein